MPLPLTPAGEKRFPAENRFPPGLVPLQLFPPRVSLPRRTSVLAIVPRQAYIRSLWFQPPPLPEEGSFARSH
jgi:hypothetical protein